MSPTVSLIFWIISPKPCRRYIWITSSGIVFIKFPSVMDSLCNHKEAATKWADGENPKCACLALRQHATSSHQPDQHLVLDGDSLHFADAPSTSIATGSLQNKIFPPSKEIYTSLRSALQSWTTRNSLPSLPKTHLDELCNGPSTPTTPRSTTTSRTRTSHASNSSSRRPSFTMKTNELHPCGSTAR